MLSQSIEVDEPCTLSTMLFYRGERIHLDQDVNWMPRRPVSIAYSAGQPGVPLRRWQLHSCSAIDYTGAKCSSLSNHTFASGSCALV
jgi:hypothetical protein